MSRLSFASLDILACNTGVACAYRAPRVLQTLTKIHELCHTNMLGFCAGKGVNKHGPLKALVRAHVPYGIVSFMRDA